VVVVASGGGGQLTNLRRVNLLERGKNLRDTRLDVLTTQSYYNNNQQTVSTTSPSTLVSLIGNHLAVPVYLPEAE